jgi:ribonuclease P protein component
MADTPVTSASGAPPRSQRPRRLTTLKRRAEFLRVRSGARWATPAFVLEGKPRSDPAAGDAARFGFTVSKQVGGAVERNRIRRRLKAAVRGILPDHARRDFDYVIVARRSALEAQFSVLVSDLVDALKRVHTRAPLASGGRRRVKG